MSLISVLAAGIAGWLFGAVWYSIMAKPWMEVSGVPLGDDGQPANRKNPVPYVTGVVAMILVAGMMRHVFVLADIQTLGKAAISGFGIGIFMVTPWLAMNYGFAGRPFKLVMIDGVNATLASTIIAIVLVLI